VRVPKLRAAGRPSSTWTTGRGHHGRGAGHPRSRGVRKAARQARRGRADPRRGAPGLVQADPTGRLFLGAARGGQHRAVCAGGERRRATTGTSNAEEYPPIETTRRSQRNSRAEHPDLGCVVQGRLRPPRRNAGRGRPRPWGQGCKGDYREAGPRRVPARRTWTCPTGAARAYETDRASMLATHDPR